MVEKEVQRDIEALLQERRRFEPPEDFAARANGNDASIYEQAEKDPDAWWESQAERLDWFTKWDRVFDWDPPHYKWFLGGKLNASYNCLDRHLESRGDQVAYHWVGEPEGQTADITYRELREQVCRFSNVLKDLGVRKGDPVAIYMPMIPELPVAILACARIGAPHSVVFGGFSPDSLRDRINDCDAKVLVTADGGYRGGKVIPTKENSDEAVKNTPSIEHVVVVRRTGEEVPMTEGRDVVYHDLMADASAEYEP